MGSAVASKSEEKKTKTQSPAASESAPLQLQRSAGATAGLPLFLQRSCSCGDACASCQDQSLLVHRKQSDVDPLEVNAGVIPAASASAPLDRNLRKFLELRIGAALPDVRIHTDAAAAKSTAALHADAYTVGRDIYFGTGKFNPETEAGKRLLAHEVAHAIQQSERSAPMGPARRGAVLVGGVNDPTEHEADAFAEKVVNPSASNAVTVGTQHKPVVRRDIGSALSGAWDAAKEGVGAVAGEAREIASDVWDAAKETAAAFIERLAPGLLPFLRDVGGTIFEKITSGLGGVMGGISKRIENQGVTGAIAGLLGDLAGTLGKAVGQLISGSCSSMVSAASSVIGFVKEIGGEAFTELGKAAKAVGAFFSEVWDDFGAPALDAIRKAAGAAWTWIEDKASWAWNKLLPIREASSAAWNWVRKEFNLAMDEGTGLLDWVQTKAKEQWFKVRDKIAPILGPLKLVAGALLLLSPLGPIFLIWKGAPVLWSALQWIWTRGLKPAGSAMIAEFRERVLPQLMAGVSRVTGLLDQASAFLCGHAAAVSAGLTSLQAALSNIPFMSPAAAAVGLAASFFGNLAGKSGCKFSDVIASAKSVLLRIYDAAKPVLELLREAVSIAALGPWAILDDGVWATLNRFVAFAQRTPCIREIAGLLHVGGAMQTIGRVRAYLKDIWQVISNQEKFEAAIHKALDGLVARIPGQVEQIAGVMSGLDGPHVHTLLNNFLVPKLASVAGHWKDMLTGMVWDIVWPWPGVMKDVDTTGKDIAKLKAALWDFEFSKAADAGLGIWRDVNGIVGHLYGWFFIASVLIGAVFGAPQAGAAVAAEVGEVLLVSTIAAEELTIKKSRLNLMSSARLALSGRERQALDREDFENMAGSIVNLGVLGVMSVLGELAADFAKAVFAEIKGIFLPEGEKAPSVEIPATPERTTEPTELPAEQLEAERAEIKQRIADPEQVRVPSEPGFDAEVEIDEHTYDRSEEDGTWCRHSTGPECGLELGDDVNEEVNKALEEREAYDEKYGDLDDDQPRKRRISDGNKMELEDSGWLKKQEPSPEARRDFMEWLKRNHLIGEEHTHLRPGSREAQTMLDRWRAEEGHTSANVPTPEASPVTPSPEMANVPGVPADVPDPVKPAADAVGDPAVPASEVRVSKSEAAAAERTGLEKRVSDAQERVRSKRLELERTEGELTRLRNDANSRVTDAYSKMKESYGTPNYAEARAEWQRARAAADPDVVTDTPQYNEAYGRKSALEEDLANLRKDAAKEQQALDDWAEAQKRARPLVPDDATAAETLALFKDSEGFASFRQVIEEEGLLPGGEAELVTRLEAMDTQGRPVDDVRHELKDQFRDSLVDQMTNPPEEAMMAKYPDLVGMADRGEAMLQAKFREMRRITDPLGPSDKGNLFERWYTEVLAPSAETHVKVPAEKLKDLGSTAGKDRFPDLIQGNALHELKNVSGPLGERELIQFEDNMRMVGKQGGFEAIPGAPPVTQAVYTFPNSGGVKANAAWMNAQLFRFRNLSFEVFNAAGERSILKNSGDLQAWLAKNP